MGATTARVQAGRRRLAKLAWQLSGGRWRSKSQSKL
jgi:hypothetical protein